MIIDGMLEGKYVNLISCTEADAEFTRDIRKNPEFVKYLPEIDNSLDQQKAWIKSQRAKEGDYFFVVWDKSGNRIGTVSVFDILGQKGKTGRLVLKGNALQNIEAQYLSFDFAFNTLNVQDLWGFIYTENHRAIRFAQTFGVTIEEPKENDTGRSIREVWFSKKNFNEQINKIHRMIYRERG